MTNQQKTGKMEKPVKTTGIAKKMGIAGNQQAVKINGKVLQLTKVSISGENIKGSWEFSPFTNVTVKCQKVADSTKVVCSVLVGKKEIAGNLSAQGMFDIISQLTGIKRERVNSMYKKSSPYRKDGKGGNNSQKFINPDDLEDITL